MKNKIYGVIVFLFLGFILIGFGACKEEDNVPTYQVETEPQETDSETAEGETAMEMSGSEILELMSPSFFSDTKAPMELARTMDEIDLTKFSVIYAADSYMPDTEAKAIYQDGYNQYFVFSSDTCFVLLTDGQDETDRTYFYSAYYQEGGTLFFIGSDTTSWYYDENGEIYLVVYTFITDSKSEISTFYTPDGKRIGVNANGQFYNDRLNEMTDEEYILFAQQVGPVSELA